VTLEVRDRGCGMSEEELARALLRFRSTKPGGTGLGLEVCREIVEAHGGTFHLVARPGGGLVVACRLPVAIEAPRGDEPDTEPNLSRRAGREE